MSYSITISANDASQKTAVPPIFIQHFNSPEEFQTVKDLCHNQKRLGWLESLVIPVRTNTFNNFCKDFFLPGLFNLALTIDDVAGKLLLCLSMLIFDIVSLPIRCITCIPRYLYNAAHPKENHPLYQYLIEKGVSPSTLSLDYVYLEFNSVEMPVYVQSKETKTITQGETFNFIQLPKNVSNIRNACSDFSSSINTSP